MSDTIAAVLRQDIDWHALPAATPAAIVSLRRRCLERDPKRRLRDIGEARIAIEAVESGASSASSAATATPARPRARSRSSPCRHPQPLRWQRCGHVSSYAGNA